MYLRATRVHVPADKINDAIHDFEKNAAPVLRKAPGNVGAGLIVNRQSGEALAITYWDSAKSLGASEQTGLDARSSTQQRVPGMQVINVERAEVTIMDRAAEPKTGTVLRVTSATGDIEKQEAGVNHVRNKVLPLAKAQKGYRAMIGAIDRQTGRAFVSTTWDTLADLEASEKAIGGTRAETAKVSGLLPETVKVEIFEAAVFDMAPAAVGQAART